MGLIIPQALLFLVHNYAEYKGFQKYTYHIIAKKKKKKKPSLLLQAHILKYFLMMYFFFMTLVIEGQRKNIFVLPPHSSRHLEPH